MSITMPQELFDWVGEAAHRTHRTRSSLVCWWLEKLQAQEDTVLAAQFSADGASKPTGLGRYGSNARLSNKE